MPTTRGPDAETCRTHAVSSARFPRNFASSLLETTWPSVWFSRAALSSLRWSEEVPEWNSFVESPTSVKGSFGSDQRHEVAVGRPEASSHDSNPPFS